jgi:hypothetical protein
MNILRTLIIAGTVALGANAAVAAESASPYHDVARIQSDIYAAQRADAAKGNAVVFEGRSSAVGAAAEGRSSVFAGESTGIDGVKTVGGSNDPFYFQQATAGSDRNAN